MFDSLCSAKDGVGYVRRDQSRDDSSDFWIRHCIKYESFNLSVLQQRHPLQHHSNVDTPAGIDVFHYDVAKDIDFRLQIDFCVCENVKALA